jgi:plastocyanin
LWTTQKVIVELYVDAKNKLYSKKPGKSALSVQKMEQTPKPSQPAKPKNRTMLYAIVVIILVVVGVGVYYLTLKPTPATNNGTPITIWDTSGSCTSASNCGFRPTNLVVKIGTNNTVTWTNTGTVPHTVTGNQTANGSLPTFSSDTNSPSGLSTNNQFTFTFTQAGTYHYYCRFHPWMLGTVTVS